MTQETPRFSTIEQTHEGLAANISFAREALSTALRAISHQRADGWSGHKMQKELDPVMLNEEEIRSVGRTDRDFSMGFCFELEQLYKHPDTYINRGKSLEVAGQYLPNIEPYVKGFLDGVELLTADGHEKMSTEAEQELRNHMKSTLDTIYRLTAYNAAESESFPGYKGQFGAVDFSDGSRYTYGSDGSLKLTTHDGDTHNYRIVPDQELASWDIDRLLEKKTYIRSEFERRVENILLRCREIGLELKKSVKQSGLELADVQADVRESYISKVQSVIDEVVQTVGTSGSDVHTRSLSYRLKTLEDLDGASVIGGFLFFFYLFVCHIAVNCSSF